MFGFRFTLISLFALAFIALLVAGDGRRSETTPTGVCVNDDAGLSTNYVISVMRQGGKSAPSELTFTKMDTPAAGEDAVARFRVNGYGSGSRNPVLLRISYLDEVPALEPGGVYALKRLQDGRVTTGCLPGSSGRDILLAVSRNGEYLVTRESRAAVSQAEEFIVFASADSAGGLAPLLVTFRAWTDGDLTGVPCQWDFGDGTQSEEQEPAHTYADEGSYVVTLTATHGTDTFTAVSTPIEVGLNISSLSSHVVDDTGAPLQDVGVSAVTEDGIAATATTDADGYYSFADLPQRTSCVAFALDGYQPANLVANLDVDNVTSYGHENSTCIVPDGGEPVAGTYHVYVHYYSGTEPRELRHHPAAQPGNG